MKRPVFEDVRVDENTLAQSMAAAGCRRGDAVRRHIASAYSHVLRAHPALDPDVLLVDITDTADGIRAVIHDGHHVPSVLSQQWTRRYKLAPWLALGASF